MRQNSLHSVEGQFVGQCLNIYEISFGEMDWKVDSLLNSGIIENDRRYVVVNVDGLKLNQR